MEKGLVGISMSVAGSFVVIWLLTEESGLIGRSAWSGGNSL